MQTQFNKAGKADTKDNALKGFWYKLSFLSSMVVFLVSVAPVEGGSYSSHFIDRGNGTVYDTMENLTWMKCEAGKSGNSCSGMGTTVNWQPAMDYCNNLNYGGRSNWTLPTVIQLKTIVNKLATTGPYTFTDVFPNTSNHWFWTSTEHSSSAYNAWGVNFDNGVAYHYLGKNYGNYFVRCVSAGP